MQPRYFPNQKNISKRTIFWTIISVLVALLVIWQGPQWGAWPLALLSMLFFGLGMAQIRIPDREVGSSVSFMLRESMIILLLLPFFAGEVAAKTLPSWPVVLCIIGGILDVIVLFLISKAIGRSERLKKKANEGVITGIANSNVLIVAIIALLTGMLPEYGMVQTILFWIAVLLIPLGAFIALREKGEPMTGWQEALLAMAAWAGFYFLIDYVLMSLGAIPTVMIYELTMMICFFIAGAKEIRSIPSALKNTKAMPHIIAFAALMAAGNLAAALTLEKANIGYAAAFISANPAITAIYSHYVYGQRLSTKRWLGVAAALLGIVVLSILLTT